MLLWKGIVLALLLPTAIPLIAETNLASIAELKQLFWTPRKNVLDFAVTGTVTRVLSSSNSRFHFLILRDASSAFEFKMLSRPSEVGSVVVLRGTLRTSPDIEPWIKGVRVTKIGFNPPPPPTSVPLDFLTDPSVDYQIVSVTGTVVDVIADDMELKTAFMLLKDGDAILPVVCGHDPSSRSLIDARVQITGHVVHNLQCKRKFTSPFIFPTNESAVVQLTPPPQDPFAFPALEDNHYISQRKISSLGKRSVRGTILATWLPNNVLMRTTNNRIMRLSLCEGEELPENNVPCTAVGYPDSDTYHINLTRARVRTDGLPAPEGAPPEATAPNRIVRGDRTINPDYHGKLLSFTGVVRSTPVSDLDKRQLLLDCGQTIVPVDFSAIPEAARNIPIGSTIEATGRCVLEIAPWQPNDVLPKIAGFLLVARRTGDLRVVVPPPWLTVGKLLIIVSVLLLALLAVFIRNRILKRIGVIRLNDRTQLAVELHDSLSQSLAGIAYQITAAQRDDDRQSAGRKLATADQMLQSCRVELKNCLFDLRNDTIAEKTLDRAIRRTIEKFDDQADISIRFNVSRALFDDSTVHAVLTIIRELVSNAITHGHAWTVLVAGTLDDGRLMFSVRDDGEGFDPKTAPGAAEGHFGLDGIRDRVKRLNGTFAIKPNAPRGIKAIVTLPVK